MRLGGVGEAVRAGGAGPVGGADAPGRGPGGRGRAVGQVKLGARRIGPAPRPAGADVQHADVPAVGGEEALGHAVLDAEGAQHLPETRGCRQEPPGNVSEPQGAPDRPTEHRVHRVVVQAGLDVGRGVVRVAPGQGGVASAQRIPPGQGGVVVLHPPTAPPGPRRRRPHRSWRSWRPRAHAGPPAGCPRRRAVLASSKDDHVPGSRQSRRVSCTICPSMTVRTTGIAGMSWASAASRSPSSTQRSAALPTSREPFQSSAKSSQTASMV